MSIKELNKKYSITLRPFKVKNGKIMGRGAKE